MSYTYLNEDEIDVELKCSICADPFEIPMNCKYCGNTYCEKCIMQWLEQQSSCPSCRKFGNNFLPVISRVVINQLNRLIVQCKLCQQMNIQRSNFTDHINSTCPKQIILCTDQCGWKGCRENLPEHLIKCRQKQNFFSQILQKLTPIIILIFAIFVGLLLIKG